MVDVLIGLGSNQSGVLGTPAETLGRALLFLQTGGVEMRGISSFYRSEPVGAHYQPAFFNMVVLGQTKAPPFGLLKLFKAIERQAGRRGQLFWGARPLDIDLIDYGSLVLDWRKRSQPGKKRQGYGQRKRSGLSLPHREMHKRSFVLKPLWEIAPMWRHPVLLLDAAHLMAVYCSPLALKRTEKLDIGFDM